MTLRELIDKLQKTDERWMDSEVCVFTDEWLNEYYSDIQVGLNADSRIKERKVFIYVDSKESIHPYGDLISEDGEDKEGKKNQEEKKDKEDKEDKEES